MRGAEVLECTSLLWPYARCTVLRGLARDHGRRHAGPPGAQLAKGHSLVAHEMAAQVGLLVCFDLFYPEVSRVLAVNKAR